MDNLAQDAPDDGASVPTGAKMSDMDLLVLIRRYEQASLGSEVAAGATISTTVFPSNYSMTTLEVDRFNALNAFFGRPLGNEVENRTQVVMPVVRDTMSWMMPQLMRIFASAKSVCRFDPISQQDEQQAELETLVVNHIFSTENSGFEVLYDAFWDALLMRNGYTEVHTEECKEVTVESYTGLDMTEMASLLEDHEDEKLEVLEHLEHTVDLIPDPAAPMDPSQPPPQAMHPSTFDLKIRRTQRVKHTRVTPLPPEEMRVTPRARGNLERAAFVMHMALSPRSDLIDQGFDKQKVWAAAAGRPNWLEMDALARNQVVDQLSIENPSDRSMQEIELRKVVMRVDYDGDGVAELRRILIAGDMILENEVVEETPFVSFSALRMPHRHTGLSIYDLVMDLQVIQTNLWRQGLDNLTISNNLRYAVDWRNVNIDDLLTSRPHGPIRGNGPPSSWIQPIQPPNNLVEQVIPALQYIDQLRSNRTGIGKGTMGLDADELQNVTKGGQLAAMSAQTLILELIARFLAEATKGMFLKIHAELMRHQDKELEFQIAGQWVKVDPSSWRKRTRVSANVGLGSGNREEMRANVQLLAQGQVQLAQMGLVGPKQAYEGFKMLCESIGINTPERFAMDPASPEYQHMMAMRAAQPPPQNPAVQTAQIKAASAERIAGIKVQGDAQTQEAESNRAMLNFNKEMLQQHGNALLSQQQAGQQHAFDASQADLDRNTDVALKLYDILKTIVASQLKGDPSVNAGQVLADDSRAARSGL